MNGVRSHHRAHRHEQRDGELRHNGTRRYFFMIVSGEGRTAKSRGIGGGGEDEWAVGVGVVANRQEAVSEASALYKCQIKISFGHELGAYEREASPNREL
jgi:hypothetical protein